MSVSVGIDFGRSGGADAVFGLERRERNRLVLVKRAPATLRILAGLATLALLYFGHDSGHHAAMVALAALPAAVVLGRHFLVLDRKARTRASGLGVLFPFWRKARPLAPFRKVVVARVDTVHQSSRSGDRQDTRFQVSLDGPAAPTLLLASAGTWEGAVPIAEALAHFLELSIEDQVQRRTRAYADLDRPVGLGSKRRRRPEPGGDKEEPGDCSFESTAFPDGRLAIRIPRPRRKAELGLLPIILVLWTLPVSLLGGSPFMGVLPLVVVFATWLKLAYGFGAEIELGTEDLRVKTLGLLSSREQRFALAEVEEIALIEPEWGGPRSAMAFAFAGVLVLRADAGSARFGHGLNRSDLERLRTLIELHIEHTLAAKPERERSRPPFAIANLPTPWTALALLAALPAAGWALGGLTSAARAASVLHGAFVLAAGWLLLGLLMRGLPVVPAAARLLGRGIGALAHRVRSRPLRALAVTAAILLVVAIAARKASFRAAARQGYDPVVSALSGIDRGMVRSCDKVQRTALHHAVRNGRESTVALLLARGADPRARDQYGRTPLHEAVSHPRILRALLAAGAPVDEVDNYQNTALLRAASQGAGDATEILLDAGASIARSDAIGNGALHLAVSDAALVEALARRGAAIDARNRDRWTPLLFAAWYGRSDSVAALLRLGADPGASDAAGNTALHHALEFGRRGESSIVEQLIAAGADPDRRNREGRSALDIAHDRGRLSEDLLRQHSRLASLVEVESARSRP